MYFLDLALNEEPIATGLPYAWDGTDGWRLIYAPDFEAGKKQTFYQGDPYRLVLDVTDLVRLNAPTGSP